MRKESSHQHDGPWSGPIEDRPWPSTLTAWVVQPGPRPRLHGYDVQDDLAQHYTFGETVLLALTGVIPRRAIGEAFEVAMQYLAATSIAEAPAHAAALARLIGAKSNGVIATGAVALAEQAHRAVADHAALLGWLDQPTTPFPSRHRSKDDEERASVRRLAQALESVGEQPGAFRHDPSPTAAIIAVLRRCGLERREQIESAWVVARMSLVCAEAFAVSPGDFRNYPMNLPPFQYVEGDDGAE